MEICLIDIHRKCFNNGAVLGVLRVYYGLDKTNCVYTCITLENERFLIDAGEYFCDISRSPKFKMQLPLINVHGRSGIRIHAGNTKDDTSGCILVGLNDEVLFGLPFPCAQVTNSRMTLDNLISVLPKKFILSIHPQTIKK